MKRTHSFAALDGMRGIAAVAVATFHSFALYGLQLTHHTELAVEFFVCLSGFVLAEKYDALFRSGLTAKAFLLRRLIRLHPMVIAGVFLGLSVTAWGCASAHDDFLGRHYTAVDLTVGASMIVFLLPAGLFLHQMLYFIDSPLWSLFFEYVASLVFSLTRGRRPTPVVAIAFYGILFFALLPLAMAARGLTFFGLGDTLLFLAGFLRIALPFSAGVFISRFSLHLQMPVLPDLIVAGLMLVTILLPLFGGRWQYDILASSAVLPAIMALGARARLTEALDTFWRHIARVSYPFYVLHLPILKAVRHYCEISGAGNRTAWIAIPSGLAIAWIIAEIVLRVYETPVRLWLQQALNGQGTECRKSPNRAPIASLLDA